ncbi:Methyltransferase domain-containing protein [Actinacidiphila yanglinensis]|uniref:Methyltransferase domain-containing protein n=1 Tax=Actinacidiphila yanglinensis TaxID=310779 RepID=A0A1H5XQU4_9ACTN|nr:class I SAM-dependent methyltransferase [Actinacidiphila yanglinensis]SEG14042.1 Methyltransferase domain-containing protein [Actinacidiphila yanglinensis]
MKVSSEYEQAWESFWRDVPDEVGGAFWDADPALASELHLPHFEKHFDPGLPLVDLGCGNGTQTRFLAERYGRVVGADLSREAVARARRADPRGAAGYEVVDAVDLDAVRALHAETGDANVYMRGVLHQCAPADRAGLVAGIAELTGRRGRVFAVELAEAAKGVLGALAGAPSGPPLKLRAVFAHGIAPGEVADAAVPGYFADAGLDVLAQGEQPLLTAEFTARGERIAVPSKWLVAGRAG